MFVRLSYVCTLMLCIFCLPLRSFAATDDASKTLQKQSIASFDSADDGMSGKPWFLESYGKGATALSFEAVPEAKDKAAVITCDGQAGKRAFWFIH